MPDLLQAAQRVSVQRTWKSLIITDDTRRTRYHPRVYSGEHLREELDALGMSAAELSGKLAVPTNRVTGILNGQRSIAGDTSLRLGRFFVTSAEFWLNLQSMYELRVAQEKRGG